MNWDFHYGNRMKLYETLPEGTIVMVFSGHAQRKTSDENYPFYADQLAGEYNFHQLKAIGFRLEDNCLVTEDGCENLTAAIPGTIKTIEAVMR